MRRISTGIGTSMMRRISKAVGKQKATQYHLKSAATEESQLFRARDDRFCLTLRHMIITPKTLAMHIPIRIWTLAAEMARWSSLMIVILTSRFLSSTRPILIGLTVNQYLFPKDTSSQNIEHTRFSGVLYIFGIHFDILRRLILIQTNSNSRHPPQFHFQSQDTAIFTAHKKSFYYPLLQVEQWKLDLARPRYLGPATPATRIHTEKKILPQ